MIPSDWFLFFIKDGVNANRYDQVIDYLKAAAKYELRKYDAMLNKMKIPEHAVLNVSILEIVCT